MPSSSRELYLQTIKSLVREQLTKALLGFMISNLPFLALPFISPITGIIASKIVSFLVDQGELKIFFMYTDFRCDQQGREFIEKAYKYEKNKNPETEKELIDSFKKFVNFTL